MTDNLDLGSLGDVLGKTDVRKNLEGWLDSEEEFRKAHPDVVEALHKATPRTGPVNLMRSAGPISDRYILSEAPASLIIGPGGSGKTTASAKKGAYEAQRMRPGPGGKRRYVLGTFRDKYINVWKATIPSWWKIFPRDIFPKWTGASPREAEHIIEFQDKWGDVVFINRFRAFGDTADPDDVLGNEFTDCYLNEWPQLPWPLFKALIDRVGRDPPMEISGRTGRFFGDGNAPDVLADIYKVFYETKPTGYVLFQQPSGLSPEAENIEAVGRAYYENTVAMNQDAPWRIKRMVHALPGFTRDNDPVYPKFDDARNVSPATLEVFPELPVMVGVDGGATPAAAYFQELTNGQMRILAEVQIERGRMRELATSMLALEARRFPDCDFITDCDPAMAVAEDTEDESDRQLLTKYLGRKVNKARTQEVGARVDAVAAKLDLTLENAAPGLILDPCCIGLRRGFNQSFHYQRIHVGFTTDRGRFAKTFDGHVHEALQYGALRAGSAELRRRVDETRRRKQEAREKNRDAKRFSPMGYRARRERGAHA